ncbi:MAG TPA: VOC family protein [Lapillicoccus sp.]|nr:VOC family protein [Lapillicoccus sp.]
MFDHVGIQAADVDAAVAFYLRVFGPIGFTEVMRHPVGESAAVGIAGRRGFPAFWIGPSGGDETRELHIAFSALSTDEVDAVHQAALDAGAEILHAPRIFPEYHPGYYAVFVRDLDGHNVEAVHHIQPESPPA